MPGSTATFSLYDRFGIRNQLYRQVIRNDKQQLLDEFAERWKAEPLVLDKWLRAQATFADRSTLATVEKLTEHSGFDFTNPNKVYALILGFTPR